MAKKIRIGMVCYKDKANKNDWEIIDLNFNLDRIIEFLEKIKLVEEEILLKILRTLFRIF
jgi:hypothetical protein